MPAASSLSFLLPSALIPPSKLSTFNSSRNLPSSPLLFSPNPLPSLRLSPHQRIRCRASVAEAIPSTDGVDVAKPSSAEVARSVMELSSNGTLSAAAPDGWPLGVGARFVVDLDGCPAICLKNFDAGRFSLGSKSSFHVQLQQMGLRTPQCTIVGTLTKPEPGLILKDLLTKWERKFGEQLDGDFLYVVSVDRVLCMADFDEAGIWVNSVEYSTAEPDPLRNFAEKLVDEMNTKHSEDVLRLARAHIETHFQMVGARLIWVDRLGFDLYVYSEKEVFEARIPFPREVTDEKGVKSTFNCMSHQAWEVEKNYAIPESEKIKILKKVGPNL